MPAYYPSGATLDIDFTTSTLGGLTFARASGATDGLFTDAAGSSYNTFPNDTPRYSSTFGLTFESQARTNYLLNSTAPATQTVTLTTGPIAVHCLWVIGTGSAAITAGTGTATGLGTATAGSPVYFTVTANGTFTVTVTGSLNRFQLEKGGSPTTFIVTAGATATRAAETCSAATGAWFNANAGTLLGVASFPSIVAINNCGIVELSDGGTTTNRILVAQVGTNAQYVVYSGSVSQVNVQFGGAVVANVPMRVAGRYNSVGTEMRGAAQGILSTSLVRPLPTGINQLLLTFGATANGGATMRIQRITYWNTALSDSDMQVVSAVQTAYASYNRPSPAWYFDATPSLQQAANDTLRWGTVDDGFTATPIIPGPLIEPATSNQIRNNSLVGAVAGNPGTPPTNWAITPTSGLSREILLVDTVNGVPRIRIHIFGTSNTAGGSIVIFESGTTQIPALPGQVFTFSCYMALVSGAIPTTTSTLTLEQRSSGGTTNLGAANSANINSQLTSSIRRISGAITTSNASTAFCRPMITLAIGATSGQVVDYTIDILAPTLEPDRSTPTSPIMTTTAMIARAADSGLLGYLYTTAAAQQSYNMAGTALMGPMRLSGRLNDFHMAGTAGMGPMRAVGQALTEYRMATAPLFALPALRVSVTLAQNQQFTGTALMPAMQAYSPLVYQGMVGRLLLVLQARGTGSQEEISTGKGLMGPMQASGAAFINNGLTCTFLLPALRANGQMRRGYDLTATMRLPAMRATGQFGQRINLTGKLFIGPMGVSAGMILDSPRLTLPPLLSMGTPVGMGTGSSGQPPVAPWFPSVTSQGATIAPRTLQQHYRGDATEELPDGINTMLQSYSVLWDATFAQSDFLIGWLRTYQGNDIRWVVPGETTARFWRIKSWQRSTVNPDHDMVQAIFEERPLP